jgi:4-aminobutyrate aminotransferase/(S)-3-amino-2-methylpropionate transaminase
LEQNAELVARRHAAVPVGVSTAAPIIVEKAFNAELWDVEGRRYIDFASGIAVMNVGHRHPKIIDAVKKQMDCFTHLAFQVTAYKCYIELAERLNKLAPFSGQSKTIFFTTGAEAVENAIKIARAATRRPAVIAFSGAFHGRTQLAVALTGKVSPYKRNFGPAIADVYRVPFPTPTHGVTLQDSLMVLEHLFTSDVDPSQVAAIIIEPVQGEGGFNPASTELLQALRQICDKNGIVLIADEIQTGFARTGKMFGIEHSGVAPDLITVAKALGGGFPLSAVIGRKTFMDAIEPGGLGGTYAGSPVACAAALAVLDVIEDERLVERANAIGDILRARIAQLAQANNIPPIAGIRGPGAMVGFDIVKSRGAQEPDGDTAKRVVARALSEGLVVLTAGMYSETIRILVPLTASDELVHEGMDCLERALVAVGT